MLTSSASVRVIERKATLVDFVRLICLFVQQPETREYMGIITRMLMCVTAIPLYAYIVIKGWRPWVILVYNQHRIIGGITLSRFGVFENGAVVGDSVLRKKALRAIVPRILAIISSPPTSSLRFRTLNGSIQRAAVTLGFVDGGDDRYLSTVMLGPLTYSRLTSVPPVRAWPHVRISTLTTYVLRPGRTSVGMLLPVPWLHKHQERGASDATARASHP